MGLYRQAGVSSTCQNTLWEEPVRLCYASTREMSRDIDRSLDSQASVSEGPLENEAPTQADTRQLFWFSVTLDN